MTKGCFLFTINSSLFKNIVEPSNSAKMSKLSKEQVLADLKEMAAGKGIDADYVAMDTNPTNVGFDSLDFVEMVMDIESKYKISISDSESRDFVTFGDICDLIVAKLPID